LSPSPAQLWKAWIPALIWLGVIALESTNLGSSEHTFRFLYPLFHYLFGMDHAAFAVWNHILRKTGHIIGYGVLSWLLFRAWRATIPVPVGRTLLSAESPDRPPAPVAADALVRRASPTASTSFAQKASNIRWSMPWARVSFLMTALVASLDEWHQSYLPSRTGRWQDAVLDSCAALAVQILLWLLLPRPSQST
jgi:VanZ family protein